MWIDINSPYSGLIVRVRDKDIGRSVRDKDGRVFFVLPRTTGEGHYASVTRIGGPKEEEKYLAMLAKEEAALASGEARSQQQIHDATGRQRSSWKGKFVILVMVLILLVLVYVFTIGPFGGENFPWRKPPAPPVSPVLPPNPSVPQPAMLHGSESIWLCEGAGVFSELFMADAMSSGQRMV